MAAALERLPGVGKVEVSLERAQAQIEFDDTKVSPEKLVSTVNLLGFRAKLLGVTPSS